MTKKGKIGNFLISMMLMVVVMHLVWSVTRRVKPVRFFFCHQGHNHHQRHQCIPENVIRKIILIKLEILMCKFFFHFRSFLGNFFLFLFIIIAGCGFDGFEFSLLVGKFFFVSMMMTFRVDVV